MRNHVIHASVPGRTAANGGVVVGTAPSSDVNGYVTTACPHAGIARQMSGLLVAAGGWMEDQTLSGCPTSPAANVFPVGGSISRKLPVARISA